MSLVRWVALTTLVVTPGLAAAGNKVGAALDAAKAPAAAQAAPSASAEAKPAAKPKFKYALELDRATRMQRADKLRDQLIDQLENDIIPKFERDNPQRPDLIFQLSEYYWEKFRFLYGKEEEANEAAYKAYEAKVAQGDKAAKAPKVDHSGSEKFRLRTMALYEQILKEHPKFEKTDQVLFSLGSNLQDLADVKTSVAQDKQSDRIRAQAAGRYEELIKRYPKSRLVPDTYVQLGDYYFDNTAHEDIGVALAKARHAYQEALKSREAKIYSYALYKLAWCDFNDNGWSEGLKKLHQVVDYTQGKGQRMADLRNEALGDTVMFYARLDQPDEAIAYLSKKADEPRRSKLIARLGEQLAEAGNYDHSTGVFRKLIRENPMRAEAPVFQRAIVSNFEHLRQRKAVKEEVKTLAETYRPGSSWWKANEQSRGTLHDAFEVSEEATRQLVTEYHEEAQKTKQVETTRLARDLYKQYVDAFASSDDPEFVSDYAFNMVFYYGEILWDLEEWEASAAAYDRVVAFKIPDRPEAKEIAKEDYRKKAAFDAILAYDKLIKIERGQLSATNLKDSGRIREDKDKGGMSQLGKGEKRDVKNAQPVELTKFEAKMVAASDAYARLPQALREPKDEVEIRYNAALIEYDKNHFDEAMERFADLIEDFPENPKAVAGADLTMYVLEQQERWEDLRVASVAFMGNKRLTKDADFQKRVALVVEGSHYKYIDEVVNKKDRKPLVAADEFLKFVAAYPKAKSADKAITYAMLLYRDAGQLDRAIQIGEQMLEDYRGSSLEPKVRFTLAKLYEQTADFQKSALMNEAFIASQDRRHAAFDALVKRLQAQKAKKASPEELTALNEQRAAEEPLLKEADEWVADAQFNAGLWWEGLGQADKAVAAFRSYLKKFPTRKDVAQIALRIATIYQGEKRYPEALRAYAEWSDKYARTAGSTAALAFRAKAGQLECARELKRKRDVEELSAEVARAWNRLTAEDKQDLAMLSDFAAVKLAKVEPAFADYQKVKLSKVRTLQKDLKTKQKQLAALEKQYIEVISLGSGEQAIAALTKIGLAYEDLAKNILESPTPPGLDEDQQNMYRSELENLATPLEDKALEAFQKALDKSYELKIYGEWTFAAQDKINSYRPGEYAQVRPVEFRGAEYLATAPLERDGASAQAAPAVEAPKQEPAQDPAQKDATPTEAKPGDNKDAPSTPTAMGGTP